MRAFLLLGIFPILNSCVSDFPTSTAVEQNIIEMSTVKIGMKKCKVLEIMGNPNRIENKVVCGKKYTILYYMTETPQLGQREIMDKDCIPFVFFNECLIGKGYLFYNTLFDKNRALKRKDEERQRYTDDRDEWAPDEHKIINVEEEDPLEKFLREAVAPPEAENGAAPKKPVDDMKMKEPQKDDKEATKDKKKEEAPKNQNSQTSYFEPGGS